MIIFTNSFFNIQYQAFYKVAFLLKLNSKLNH